MTELTAADVLADLFDSEDYLELTATDAATLVLKRLTDAGFEVRSAWPVEAKDTVTPHECSPVAWRYQRKVGWEGVWRVVTVFPIFETPDDWTVEPLCTAFPRADCGGA